jgi:prolyl-tRNA editing enzyme YbaK/EbsC (Cys-tRNA(Pro) deacylase)
MKHIITFNQSTRTAAEAAEQLGCTVAQIAKSIVFRTTSNKPVLAIMSGVNRVDVDHLSQLVGEPLLKADADFVKTATGHVIGGVPPYGHMQPIMTFIDQDLQQYGEVWASAGTVNSVFKTTFEELLAHSHATLL